jgi:hypothetical protein
LNGFKYSCREAEDRWGSTRVSRSSSFRVWSSFFDIYDNGAYLWLYGIIHYFIYVKIGPYKKSKKSNVESDPDNSDDLLLARVDLYKPTLDQQTKLPVITINENNRIKKSNYILVEIIDQPVGIVAEPLTSLSKKTSDKYFCLLIGSEQYTYPDHS